MKKVNEKLFTNDESNIIIKKKYNPSNKNCKIFEREGLQMKEKDEIIDVVEELSKKYGKRKQVITILLEECKKLGCNIDESKEKIKDFFNI